MTWEKKDKVPVMLDIVLPLSDKTACDSNVLIWGIKMSILRVPLHKVHLHSPVTTGHVKAPSYRLKGFHLFCEMIWLVGKFSPRLK